MGTARVDKFLWEVRLFKTRSLAADVCRRGRVYVDEKQVKPAHVVSVGDVVKVRKGPAFFSFEVLEVPNGRVGAKLVGEYLRDITPQDQLDVMELCKMNNGYRMVGAGRPTKKDRRNMEQFVEEMCEYDSFFEEEDA